MRTSFSVMNRLSVSQIRDVRKSQITAQQYGFVRYDIPKLNDSEDSITALTQAPNNGFMASADSTGLIKIWTDQKILVREIQFPEPINALRFISSAGDLMIGHSQTLSLITAQQINENRNEVYFFGKDQLQNVS